MKILDVYPPGSAGKRPRCAAKLSYYSAERNERWSKDTPNYLPSYRRNGTVPNDECGHFARYLIDNKYYCRKHAGYVVLDALSEKPTKESHD